MFNWMRVLGLLCVSCLSAYAQTPLPAPIKLQTPLELGDRQLTLDVSLQLAPSKQVGGPTRVNALVDLGPVIAELRAAVRGKIPTDRCRRHAADNWVGELQNFVAWVDSDRLVLEVDLQIEVWACFEVHRTELRKRLSRAQVGLQLPLRIDARQTGLRLQFDRPRVRARGPLADAARHYLTLRGEELGEILARRVARLNAKQGVFAVPTIWLFEGKLKSARFVDAGRPSIEIQAELQPKLPIWADWMLGR